MNRSVTGLSGASREFRLPKGSAFAPLNRKALTQPTCAKTTHHPGTGGATLLVSHDGALPEMATDVIDPSVNYATENVKRNTTVDRPWLQVGLGFLIGRTAGSGRMARS